MKEINFNDCNSFLESQKKFSNKLEEFISEKTTKIVSNGNLVLLIQDLYDMKIEPHKIESHELYSVGKILEKELLIDPMQLWSDNKIYLIDEDGNNEIIHIIDNKMILI